MAKQDKYNFIQHFNSKHLLATSLLGGQLVTAPFDKLERIDFGLPDDFSEREFRRLKKQEQIKTEEGVFVLNENCKAFENNKFYLQYLITKKTKELEDACTWREKLKFESDGVFSLDDIYKLSDEDKQLYLIYTLIPIVLFMREKFNENHS